MASNPLDSAERAIAMLRDLVRNPEVFAGFADFAGFASGGTVFPEREPQTPVPTPTYNDLRANKWEKNPSTKRPKIVRRVKPKMTEPVKSTLKTRTRIRKNVEENAQAKLFAKAKEEAQAEAMKEQVKFQQRLMADLGVVERRVVQDTPRFQAIPTTYDGSMTGRESTVNRYDVARERQGDHSLTVTYDLAFSIDRDMMRRAILLRLRLRKTSVPGHSPMNARRSFDHHWEFLITNEALEDSELMRREVLHMLMEQAVESLAYVVDTTYLLDSLCRFLLEAGAGSTYGRQRLPFAHEDIIRTRDELLERYIPQLDS